MQHLMPLIESFYASPNYRWDEPFPKEKLSSPLTDLLFCNRHKTSRLSLEKLLHVCYVRHGKIEIEEKKARTWE
jgi:hypothetical protein